MGHPLMCLTHPLGTNKPDGQVGQWPLSLEKGCPTFPMDS